MATSTPTVQTTTSAPSGLSTDTIIIIVGAVAGTLFFIVLAMLCVVSCLYYRRSRKSDKEDRKEKDPPEKLDRIFRPVDWENPHEADDLDEIGHILWEESQSRRGSIAMRNPAYKEDDEDEQTTDIHRLSNGHATPVRNGNGPPRPPKLNMLPPERTSMKSDSSKPKSPTTPSSATDTHISILNMNTWGAPDLTADIVDDDADDVGYDYQDNGVSTVSGPHNDPDIDYSVFGPGMRGSMLQENTLRRSLRSRNQAVVDFYESGYSNSMGGRSVASLPMSRMDYEMESDTRPVSGYGTGNRMLWQKRKFDHVMPK